MDMRTALETRPTLRAWLGEYAAIRRDYAASVARLGVDLAPAGRLDRAIEAARTRVLAKGAHVRNAGASLWTGELSPACVACADGLGSQTFALTMRCNRSCYFCFNKNQLAGDRSSCPRCADWRAELDAFAASVAGGVTHVGITGGEPLLHKEESYAFVQAVRAEYPDAHVRLYTAGDFLDDACLAALRDAGLDELRMSVKLDVADLDRADAIVGEAVERLARAREFIGCVLVEMPVIPGTGDAMRRLLRVLDGIGVFGVNLLEFGYPVSDWAPFRERGFAVRNPPYAIPYDYSYPAGLPIDGSELLCLELLEYALDEGLALNVHYCSLENKNRGQVFRQNAAVSMGESTYELDGGDFFYKVAKVFDGDVAPVRAALAAAGEPCVPDEEERSLAFRPSRAGLLAGLPVVPALSYNVVETTARGSVLREVALEVMDGFLKGDGCMENTAWLDRATAWELLALSFAYPGEELAGALASGEWAEAACEIAGALNVGLAEGWDEGLAAYEGRDVEGLLHELRREATRLMVGAPQPAVSPYEGVWRAADDGVRPLLYVNPHSMAVERAMRACGMGRPAGTNDPIDRVDTELEFLQWLCMVEAGTASLPGGVVADALPGGSAAGAYRAFREEHVLAWVPRFADAVEAETRAPFYRAAAALLRAMLRAEALAG